MKFFGKSKGKEPQPKKSGKIKVSVEGTTFGGNGIIIPTNPVTYVPRYNFPPYFKAYATFFYIPPIAHRIIQSNPHIYHSSMGEPLKPGQKIKPISYSIELIDLFRRKENLPLSEKGRIHFGKLPVVLDNNLNETRRNDLALNLLINQYREDFKNKLKFDPIALEEFDAYNEKTQVLIRDAFHYPDNKDPTKIHGIDDVSREQFTLYALNDTIAIADGRTIRNQQGYLENKPSTNGTSILNLNNELKDISLRESKLEFIARAPISEFHKAFAYTYATFGHEILTMGDKYSGIKGHTFIMLVTPEQILKNIEDLKEEFAFKHAR